MAGGRQARRWEFYRTELGADLVAKELEKSELTTGEKAKLKALLSRAESGTLLPKDVKSLGDGLLELRMNSGARTFRLFYAHVGDGLVLLALTFFMKKSTSGIRTPPAHLERARKRLADWQARNPAPPKRPRR